MRSNKGTDSSVILEDADGPDTTRLSLISQADDAVFCFPNHIPMRLQGFAHQHECGQLTYSLKGRYRIIAGDEILGGSPQQAIWVPPGVMHYPEIRDDLFVQAVYVRTDQIDGLPKECTAISVSPLLRELLSFATSIATDNRNLAEYSRIMLAITDQIRMAETIQVQLPMSEDNRLKPVLSGLLKHPDDNRPLEAWAEVARTSKRTLARLFVQETKMTFREWRQRLRIMDSITRLGNGEPVVNIAMDLGYSSQSAFTSMFRRSLGHTPSRLRGQLKPGMKVSAGEGEPPT